MRALPELFQLMMARSAPAVHDTSELAAKRNCAGVPIKLMVALVESRTWPPQAFVNPAPRVPPRSRSPVLVKVAEPIEDPQSTIEPRRYTPSVINAPPVASYCPLTE